MPLDPETIVLANRLADASGAVIRPYFRKRLEVFDKGKSGPKPVFDPVTDADRAAETAIRDILHRERPQDGILGEEHGHEAGTSGLTWIIDPIDGTRAFITGRHTWGTLIALHNGDRPVLGIIDQPTLRERFIGYEGTAEMISPDGRTPLRVRPCAALDHAVVSTTHPWGYFTRPQRSAFENVCEAAQLSYFGGDCYAYALLAMGFIDCVIEGSLAPWDVAALIPVIENAGGIVTGWEGEPFQVGAQIIASGDRRVHAEAVAILRKAI